MKTHRNTATFTCVIVLLVSGVLQAASQAAEPANAATPAGKADAPSLIAALQKADTSEYEKAQACRQLANLGDKQAVGALAALLGDEHLSCYARSALEAIADPAAGKALQEAADKLKGKPLIGAINSIGIRRDADCVPALARLADGNDADAAAAALAAMGQIATPQAAEILQKALSGGPAARKAAAADACLICAARQAAHGEQDAAAKLYDVVVKADVPKQLRAAAMRGAITVRKASGLPMLLEQLRSGDKEFTGVALSLARDFPGAEATAALAGELAKVSPAVQAVLVGALADRKDVAAAGAVESLITSESPEVRLAAIAAMGKLGAASSASPLLRVILDGKVEAESQAAATSLGQMVGKETEDAILQALSTAAPDARVKLIAILGSRNAGGAAAALFKDAANPDPAVCKTAFLALANVSRGNDLAEIVRLATACKDESVQQAAERAVFLTCIKVGPGARCGPILAAMKKTTDPAVTCSLLRMLRGVGDYKAYLAIRAALDNADAKVRDVALRCLVDWPDATPASILVNLAAKSSDKVQRALALRGALRLVGMIAGDCAIPSRQAIGWMEQLQKIVDKNSDGEKRLLLSALANVKCVQGLCMVREYMDDASVKTEAAMAVIQIASEMPALQRPMAKGLLQQVVAATSGTVKKKAEELLRQIPSAAELKAPELLTVPVDVSTLTFVPLFDGKTFEGWEGDTAGTFRVEDGAVVGGSLKTPIPQNEFLCTRRSYANFVLRLECRLLGPTANGGVQIRSLRVPNSAEMCGAQADMSAGSNGGYWGSLYDESRRGGFLGKAETATIVKMLKQNDWNLYEIRCQGPRIQLFINGVQTVDYTEKEDEILQSGLIGLQIHGGKPSESWYRNIAIAEFP